MTFNEMRRKCLRKYIELWGEEWVEARKPSIGDGYTEADEDGILKYSICQGDKLLEPPASSEFDVYLSHDPPQHCTEFKCNMKTGEVELVEHY